MIEVVIVKIEIPVGGLKNDEIIVTVDDAISFASLRIRLTVAYERFGEGND